MKKLVTAFAACALAGLAFAQVESVNIVGYQTLSGNAGFTVVAPTFVSVGSTTDEFTFGDIQGDFVFFDTLQFFDSAGNVNFQAYWLDENFGLTPGWYDDAQVSLATTPVPAGSAFFASMASGGSIVIAGQVSADDVVISAGAGFTVIGNCRPYDVTFGDLVCTGISFFDTLQFFDAAGNVNFQAYWLDENFGLTPGWYDDAQSSLNSTVIPSGQGFFLSAANAGATVTIPAPTL